MDSIIIARLTFQAKQLHQEKLLASLTASLIRMMMINVCCCVTAGSLSQEKCESNKQTVGVASQEMLLQFLFASSDSIGIISVCVGHPACHFLPLLLFLFNSSESCVL